MHTCTCVLQVIPAENLVAAFQSGAAKLLGVATSASDAQVMLEALELGTAGVVLRTEDPLEVRMVSLHLMTYHSKKCHRPRTSSCHKEQRGIL